MEQEIISHLSRFVSFRTIEGANEVKKECLDWVAEAFLSCRGKAPVLSGVEACLAPTRGNVEDCPYLYLPYQNPKLLWFAHCDIVPAKDEQFTLKQEGDKLIGRGTSDMKGNALPFLMAYKEACEHGDVPPISILLTSDEETAGPTIPKLLEEGTFKNVPVAFTPDTKDRIVVEHKGVAWCELICTGKGTHGAYPWKGENPIPLLGKVVQEIQKAFPDGGEEDWQMTVSFTKLTGSIARNQTPEVATCGLDVRFPPEVFTNPEDAIAEVEKHLPKDCSIEVILTADPLGTDPNHAMVQLVKKIAEEVTGKEVKFEREHGGTDARYFGSSGIPSFLYGPEGEGLHGANEWVSLKSLCQQYQMMKSLCHTLQVEG